MHALKSKNRKSWFFGNPSIYSNYTGKSMNSMTVGHLVSKSYALVVAITCYDRSWLKRAYWFDF